jgi:hypothetical protein
MKGWKWREDEGKEFISYCMTIRNGEDTGN